MNGQNKHASDEEVELLRLQIVQLGEKLAFANETIAMMEESRAELKAVVREPEETEAASLQDADDHSDEFQLQQEAQDDERSAA